MSVKYMPKIVKRFDYTQDLLESLLTRKKAQFRNLKGKVEKEESQSKRK
jgi:hypothetical protein